MRWCLFLALAFAQNDTLINRWLQQLTLRERIGQLIFMPAYTDKIKDNFAYVKAACEQGLIGGIIFMSGTPYKQALYFNQFQKSAKIPLLVAQDVEWGLKMRLDSTIRFPKQMALGAIRNDSLIYQFGKALAQQCKAMGIHICFGPVLDVNNNPKNPVINDRSFGSDPHKVAQKGLLVIHGLQNHGVVAVAKHFPGHGDTDIDSHTGLPVIYHDKKTLWEVDLYPFRHAIAAGVQGIMSAHIHVPALDSVPNRPATLSPFIMKTLLRDSLHFQGVVFTDALNMRGVLNYAPLTQAAIEALKAGNDVLLFVERPKPLVEALVQAVLNGKIPIQIIDEHVKRILKLKYQLGLLQHPPQLSLDSLYQRLYHPQIQKLSWQLYRSALTLVKNESHFLPIKHLSKEKIAYLQVGGERWSPFFYYLNTYTLITPYYLPKTATRFAIDTLITHFQNHGYTTVVVAFMQLSRYAHKRYGITKSMEYLTHKLQHPSFHSVLVLFGNPYALDFLSLPEAVLVTYEERDITQRAAAEAIFGGYFPDATLPVQLNKHPYKGAISYPTVRRWRLAYPEELNMDKKAFEKIDTLLTNTILGKAAPCVALLVLKDNALVYHKAYGYLTYDSTQKLQLHRHSFDLASITKVLATTLAIMKLYEEGKLLLYHPIKRYLPETNGLPIGELRISELLLHRSGLPAWYPYWKRALRVDTLYQNDSTFVIRRWLSTTPSDTYAIRIGENLYLHRAFPDSMWYWIIHLQPRSKKRQVYSDFNMIILGKIVERITKKDLYTYVKETFYEPMGLRSLCFNPWAETHYPYEPVPSTFDLSPYRGVVKGFVNDDNAAMMGGIAGHAGLFGNIYDIAKLLTMLMNGGVYEGKRYLEAETIALFTRRYGRRFRRGLGWDKPETRKRLPSPTSRFASEEAFGHLGFTGTAIWVDPKYQLIYILLSNRTYPSENNKKFIQWNIRTRVLDLIYQSFLKHV